MIHAKYDSERPRADWRIMCQNIPSRARNSALRQHQLGAWVQACCAPEKVKIVTASSLKRYEVHKLHHELPIFVEQFPIHMNFAVLAHVADHIPVDSALVLAAGIGIPRPERDMH